MLYLKPITIDNINDFTDTEYDAMPLVKKQDLIKSSTKKNYNGQYFEFFVIYSENIVIGFINLYSHSKHIISCSPTIKAQYQKKGFGFIAEKMALDYASKNGYTVAVGAVPDDNSASISLHEKLDFEFDRVFYNKNGRLMRNYIKVL